MPVYEYYCDNCRREIPVTLPIREHDKGVPACNVVVEAFSRW
jgi:predicted nucleic acid-binding Zn ribbon protein